MAKKKGRRTFTAEYKTEVVRLVETSGKSVLQVAQELGLSEGSVRAWVKQAVIDRDRSPGGALTTDERAELVRLRRQLKEVSMERDFLERAAAFFARGKK